MMLSLRTTETIVKEEIQIYKRMTGGLRDTRACGLTCASPHLRVTSPVRDLTCTRGLQREQCHVQ